MISRLTVCLHFFKFEFIKMQVFSSQIWIGYETSRIGVVGAELF